METLKYGADLTPEQFKTRFWDLLKNESDTVTYMRNIIRKVAAKNGISEESALNNIEMDGKPIGMGDI